MGQKKLVTKIDETPEQSKNQAPALVSKKNIKRQVINGIAYINVSYNNTTITITDTKGEVLAWATSGLLGFKGAKKSTPYAANAVAKNVTEKIKKFNLINLKITVKGIGPGRESAIRSMVASGLNITAITDRTPIAHNGVRAPKPRRV